MKLLPDGPERQALFVDAERICSSPTCRTTSACTASSPTSASPGSSATGARRSGVDWWQYVDIDDGGAAPRRSADAAPRSRASRRCSPAGWPRPAVRAKDDAPGRPNVLRYAFVVAETGFDPALINDLYSRIVTPHIFEAMYRYDYLARPAKVVPLTAVDLPEIGDDFRTWTIRIRPGIYFADDPAFERQAARAGRGGLRLLVEALLRPGQQESDLRGLQGRRHRSASTPCARRR